MKKILIFIPVLFILIMSKNLFAIDTNAIKLYPLTIGNSWTYKWFNPFLGLHKYKYVITGTITTNAHFYYVFTTYSTEYSPSVNYIRIDSLRNTLLYYTTTQGCQWLINESVSDSLSARQFDSSKTYNCNSYYRCTDDTSHRMVFGNSRLIKKFYWTNYFEGAKERTFVQNIGLISDYVYAPAGSGINTDLLGCVINGVMYGDTSLLGIATLSNQVPEKFALYQNYPNPFNPSTKIKFSIPPLKGVRGMTSLFVYDALGQEVTALVNEQLDPGIYETEWDASNFPSGIYFYKLEAGDYTETKKMILIK
jgi:hypothetical protein